MHSRSRQFSLENLSLSTVGSLTLSCPSLNEPLANPLTFINPLRIPLWVVKVMRDRLFSLVNQARRFRESDWVLRCDARARAAAVAAGPVAPRQHWPMPGVAWVASVQLRIFLSREKLEKVEKEMRELLDGLPPLSDKAQSSFSSSSSSYTRKTSSREVALFLSSNYIIDIGRLGLGAEYVEWCDIPADLVSKTMEWKPCGDAALAGLMKFEDVLKEWEMQRRDLRDDQRRKRMSERRSLSRSSRSRRSSHSEASGFSPPPPRPSRFANHPSYSPHSRPTPDVTDSPVDLRSSSESESGSSESDDEEEEEKRMKEGETEQEKESGIEKVNGDVDMDLSDEALVQTPKLDLNVAFFRDEFPGEFTLLPWLRLVTGRSVSCHERRGEMEL